MRRAIIIGACIAVLLAAACGNAAAAACAKASGPVPVTPAAALPKVDAAVAAKCMAATAGSADRLVDARRAGGLRAAIPGAVAADLDAGGAPLPFGAGERVLLVGDSTGVRHLVAQCARLQASGYARVRVLAGGFEAWRRTADASAVSEPPAFVTADALEQRALDAPHALVFDAAADKALRPLGDAAHVARTGETPAVAAQRIARELERRKVAPGLDPVLVVLADRASAPAWRDAWNATVYPDPQFYIGTNKQFRSDVARTARIAAERGKPLPGPCDR